MKYDVFICHASEDKPAFVRPLARALSDFGVAVWYDEFSLRPGDKLARSIDRGLAASRFGVVVLSPRFFGRGWPERELGGLVARDVDGPNVIIPIWYQVSKADIVSYSPPLADIVAIHGDDGPLAVAKALLAVVRASVSEDQSEIARAQILLENGYCEAAVLLAARHLEGVLKDIVVGRLGYAYFKNKPVHSYSLRHLLILLQQKNLLRRHQVEGVDWDTLVRVRNQTTHGVKPLAPKTAEWFVATVARVLADRTG